MFDLAHSAPPKTHGFEYVEVEVVTVGLCATDLNFSWIQPPAGSKKLCSGHEVLVKWNGKLYMVVVREAEPHAPKWVHQMPHMCPMDLGFVTEMGIYRRHGGLRPKMWVRKDSLILVPDGLSPLLAPFGETISTIDNGYRLARRHREVNLDEVLAGGSDPFERNIVILGDGKAAQIATTFFQVEGFNTLVIARNPEDHARVRLIRELGADYRQLPVRDGKAVDWDRINGFTADIRKSRKWRGQFQYLFDTTASYPLILALKGGLLSPGGGSINYGIPEGACVHTMDLGPTLTREVLASTFQQGAVNADKRSWVAAVQALPKIQKAYPKFLAQAIHVIDGMDILEIGDALRNPNILKPMVCPNGRKFAETA